MAGPTMSKVLSSCNRRSGLKRDVALGDDNGLAEVRPMSRGSEAVTARPAQPVAREQLDRARRAYPPSWPYSPTALEAFSRNKEPSRMYLRSIAVPLWPVCSAMTRSGTPAAAAEVARPARSECPATSSGSSPARAAWRFNTRATACALSRVAPMCP